MKVLLSKTSEAQILSVLNRKPHAIGIYGPEGSGKAYLAQYLKDKITNQVKNENILVVRPNDKGKITVEQARQLPKFIQLKTADSKSERIIIIEDADKMTVEAQNAILKNIEELPNNTTIILTFPNLASILPTISSRLNFIKITPPTINTTIDFFNNQYSDEQIIKAYKISNYRIGLMTALLKQEQHDVIKNISLSKQILSSSSFDRICMIESLSKSEVALLLDSLLIVSKAAFVSAINNGQSKKVTKLAEVRKAVFKSMQKLQTTPNYRLLLTDLMLRI
ncbi:AAA family ATPase [Candidatus Saccharibacteria bacterium]|nr:AAA family ATPase [Candidatus Saccharibacteria bacterium]